MAPKLTIVKSVAPRQPMEVIHFDMNDLDTRTMIFNHIRHQTLHAYVEMLEHRKDPMSMLASIPAEMLRNDLHEKAWKKTFETYPQMSDAFNYVIDTENLTITEAERKKNGNESDPA